MTAVVSEPTTTHWVSALHASHERLTSLVASLDEAALRAPSYDADWTVAQVLSHLGSQAEIYGRFLTAGLEGAEAPGSEAFQPIWDTWNARGPVTARDESLAAEAALLARIDALSPAQADAFRLDLFGGVVDLAGWARLRLAEHAVHTWDVAVTLDPSASVSPDAVDLLVDRLGMVARWTGKPGPEPYTVRVETHDPERVLLVSVDQAVTLAAAPTDGTPPTAPDGLVRIGAEGFLRLVYGRLDAAHTPELSESGNRGVNDLRSVFPGP